MIKILKHFIYACLGGFLAFTVLVYAQSQSGFISIDCGIAENMSYTDNTTGLNYVSDVSFSGGTGLSHTISLEHAATDDIDQQFLNLTSFPEGDRNCYTLRPSDGKDTKYLIRARFLYGNYDDKDSVPAFDLYIGANKWGSVKLEDSSTEKTMEIIHIPRSDFVFVCVANTGHGTPFVSVLELRPVKNSTYASTRAAVLYRRMDIGSQTNKSVRYKDDIYDRIWEPFNFIGRNVIRTSLAVDSGGKTPYQPSPAVMSTAMSPANDSLDTFWFLVAPANKDAMHYTHFYFAELEKLGANESRSFEIFQNFEHVNGPFSPNYLYSTIVSSDQPTSGERILYEINKTASSTHPPILNALEVYAEQDFLELDTYEEDAEAMMKIKAEYGVKKNWQGDPCAPITYIWDGLNCSFNGQDLPRIISLNLASSGLTGEINSHISDLSMIEHLNLSNNSLTGSVPEFLSNMHYLKVLDLSGNNLTGSIPVDLVERSQNGSLLLSVSGNKDLCSLSSCGGNSTTDNTGKKKNQLIVPIIASVVTLLILLIALVIIWIIMKRRKTARKGIHARSALQSKNNEFTYAEIIAITDNFERIIGKGGFGTVFHGNLNGTQVAVKMLSVTSGQGPKEFQAEVKLLMRVHHRNLTSLIGYCNEDGQMGLIYEYMANGNLAMLLSDKSDYSLSWEDRMRVAIDAAQGLEYLHHGCRPPIIHRDVKTANILLNAKFQAKLADFGLSRDFPMESGTHVSTALAGTLGYLDPECFETSWLNEKSDIYSIGVVLLQILTSKPAIIKINDEDNVHLSVWVNSLLAKGEIKEIVDPKLCGYLDINSAWKAVEIATSCLKSSRERPTMNEVVIGLKESLALETSSKNQGSSRMGDLNHSSANPDTSVLLSPVPR